MLTSFILLLTLSFTVQAQNSERAERRAEMKERMETRMAYQNQGDRKQKRMFSALDLSEEQKEQIKGIMLEGKKEAIPVQNELREKRARMRTLSSGDTYDTEALKEVADEMAQLHASLKKIHIEKKGDIRALLTDDQKVIFDSIPDRRERMKKRIARRNK